MPSPQKTYMTQKERELLHERLAHLMALKGLNPDEVDKYYVEKIQPTLDQAIINLDYKFFEGVARFIKKKNYERLKNKVREIVKNEEIQ